MVDLPGWSRCLFDEELRHIALFGGRGGAKSWSIASALVARAYKRHERVLCAREIQQSIRDSVKRLLDDCIERAGLRGSFISTDNEIRGPHDSLFTFAGLRHNSASIRSAEGITVCWVTEAQRASKKSLEDLTPTIRRGGSQIIADWNPQDATDPIDEMFRGENGPPPRSHVQHVNYIDNPWFPDVLREQMEYDKRRDPDKYQHVWLGGYLQNSESRVFRNWVIEEFEAPADAIHRQGADFGFAVDPTVLVRCHIVGRTLYIDYEAYRIGCEITDTPDLFREIPDSEKWPITADSARPETISHIRKNGFPKIFSSVKGANSVVEGVEWLKSFDIKVHPRCTHTIDELSTYSYKLDPLTGRVLPLLKDKKNHVIDGIRYACEGARRSVKSVKATANVQPIVNHWSRGR